MAPKVGLQLIVYGRRPGEDLAGVTQEAKEAGYAGIEAGNLFDMVGKAQAQDAIAASGLAICGTHSGYGDCKDAAKVESAIDYLKAVGAKYYIISGVAEGEGLEQYERAAETFNNLGAMLADEGVVFCYHNHNWEFQSFDGVKGIHRLCELTDPNYVKLCIDVYWVTIGGEDPKEFVARYAARAPYYHFKDGAPGSFTELGNGTVDLPGAAKAAVAAGADWIVTEQDSSQVTPLASVAFSRGYLKGLGL
jgi:sugar phosphate isomerase/epimerase